MKLDRLGRSARDVLNLVHELESREHHSGSLSQLCRAMEKTPPSGGRQGADWQALQDNFRYALA